MSHWRLTGIDLSKAWLWSCLSPVPKPLISSQNPQIKSDLPGLVFKASPGLTSIPSLTSSCPLTRFLGAGKEVTAVLNLTFLQERQ
jgi:hypothetical protein